jgi:hypothetical protein
MLELVITQAFAYIGAVATVAVVAQFFLPPAAGERLMLRMADFAGQIQSSQVDEAVRRIAKRLSAVLGRVYGAKLLCWRHIALAGIVAFTYCVVFAYVEESLGYPSPIVKQLKFWLVPSWIADIVSVMVTRHLLLRVQDSPKRYVRYLALDSVVAVACYYASFAVAMLLIYETGWYQTARVVTHPFYMAWFAYNSRWAPVFVLPVVMALTTALPTVAHFASVCLWWALRQILPPLGTLRAYLIDRVWYGDERNAVGATILAAGMLLGLVVVAVRAWSLLCG